MTEPDHPPTEGETDAREVLHEYLRRLGRREHDELSSIARQHPVLAPAVAKLRRSLEDPDGEWPELSTHMSQLLHEALRFPEPTVTATVDPGDAESSSVGIFRRGRHQPPPPRQDLQPGQIVGDFRLVSPLGEGGMGQVWEAEQTSLGGRHVAVKFMRPDRFSPAQMKYFAREARAGGRLHHPGIVAVHATGESEGLAWIALELVEGAWTLRDFLDEVGREDEVPAGYDREVARFMAEIAEAMQTAHEGGVIHRDLKPQNVLITPDNHPKVTDFGLARLTDETAISQTGDFAGTYFYMSPEQVAARHAGIDHRTDVFSLGVVMYEMLTLHRPFQGDTSHQVAAQILAKDPPDPRTYRSRIPHDLGVIAGKALEKDRDKRFQTMGELAADLRRWLANEPILARPPGTADRMIKWVRRNPTWSAAGAVAAVAFAAISVLLLENVRARESLELSVRELAEQTRVAEAHAEAEKDRLAEVLRLSAMQDYEDLIREAEVLWPAHPENIEHYEAWIPAAWELVDDIPQHHEQRARLQAMVLTGPEEQRHRDWWNTQLGELIDELEGLRDEDTGLLSEAPGALSPEHGWSIPRRLAFADRLRDEMSPGGEWHERWREAIAAIRTHSLYGELELAPQAGLVPIGEDPESWLWEFWHVATGEQPERGEDGRLVVTEETGLVLVLIPGGEFWMGADADPDAPHNHDPGAEPGESPVHRVELSPYFLSKYEMTQGQWQRFTGRNPSEYLPERRAHDLRHPVERVSWLDCMRELERIGLTLPSETQWENGCRAGTETPWWTGAERESLREENAANLADQAAARRGGTYPGIRDWPDLDDGYGDHAPVGTYAPNPFGLHEVHGNVWEWCLDGVTKGFYSQSPTSDPVAPWEGAAGRVKRGGSFYESAARARSAVRRGHPPGNLDGYLGVRPAMNIAD